jgi:Poly(3-hydroxybutyrate) depolymerase
MAPQVSDQQKPENALAPVLDALQASFSVEALKELQPTTRREAKSVRQVGDQLTVTRDGVEKIPMTADFLNGNIKIQSMDVGNIKADINHKTHTATNIQGISLNLTMFGSQHAMDVKSARLAHDANGKPFLYTEIENPLPESAQRIIGMPPTISVGFPLGRDKVGAPKLSEVFTDAASKTGPSIAGLLAADAFNEASKVSLFAESNPEWIKNIVEPVARGIYKEIADGRLNIPTAAAPGKAGNPNDAKTAGQVQKPGTPVGTQVLSTAPVDKRGDHSFDIPIEGVSRHFQVHVPPSYNGKTPMPVILLVHGQGQDGKEIASWTQFNKMADAKGFIAVYPDSREWAGNKMFRTWDTDNGLLPPGAEANDVGFMRKIIEQTEKEYLVDPKRIYMAGLSNGGMLAFRAASDLSDKLAAIAVVSSAMSGTEPPIKQPISLLNIHGDKDILIPYDGLKNVPASLKAIGLPNFKPSPYTTDYFVEQNKITQHPIVLEHKGVTERKFLDQTTGTEVKEYTIHGGDHVPDNIQQLTGTIWEFFESHPKSSGTVSGTVQPPMEQPFNLAERIQGHIRTRGMRGLELDAGDMISEVRYLNNGSFSPSGVFSLVESRTGLKLDDEVSKIVKSTLNVEKQGDKISVDMDGTKVIPINGADAGPVQLKSVSLSDGSFNLQSDKMRPAFRNIKGVDLNIKALGQDLTVGVTEVTQKLNTQGDPYYRVKTTNPMGSLARTMLLADREIPIEVKLDKTGAPTLLNETELKDSALGVNPVFRGYLDTGNHIGSFVSKPTFVGGLNAGKDLLFMGGSAYGGYRLAAINFGRRTQIGAAVTAGLIIAPAVIHGVERLID